ncbi:MAG: uracil-xanthine permease family protein [Lachnospirales bacterium]
MEHITGSKRYLLAVQHVLAMFGATVLVPILTGLPTSLALLSAGVGTLLFHSVTKGMVPAFLGSSFAFIGAIALILQSEGIASVKGGVIIAGFVYIAMSLIIKIFGVEKVRSFFPPIVTGPVIIVIGLRLSPTALSMAGYSINENGLGQFDIPSLIIALSVVVTMVVVTIFAKGFFKLVPILISVIVGYIVATIYDVVDFSIITNAPIFGFDSESLESFLTMPKFTASAISAIAPIALVVFIEHIGDITTNGSVVGKDFFKEPGIHRTMLGDGVATVMAGLIGGPPNTTYSENTGVLAVTKVYDPSILRLAAIYAIIISLFGKFSGFVQSIPTAVMGGVSIILFGMIASVGLRTLIDEQLDFSHSRNLLITSLILVTGISIDNIFISGTLSISGLAVSALIGVVLNKLLPKNI